MAPLTTSIEALDLPSIICRYAERFHAAGGSEHHVASPLGAWLLLSLCGQEASGRLREDLTSILGVDTSTAGFCAARLLDEPHQAVASAVAAWTREGLAAEGLAAFLASLPVSVERGGRIPTTQELDEWVRQHTFGLIDAFPGPVDPSASILLASALATKVKWLQPFTIAPAATLGAGSDWSRALTRVLGAEADDDGNHVEFIARTDRAGDVAVHSTKSPTGIVVTSVIAQPDVPARDVIATAHDIATRLATRSQGQISLFDLPLGESSIWRITERETKTSRPGVRVEAYSAFLPAWEARSHHNLLGRGLGFEQAAALLAELAGLPLENVQAKQSAMARYTRVGFEAAAVTMMSLRFGSSSPEERGLERHAELRFGHPFAVVALATDDTWNEESDVIVRGPWHGIPVFSAWVAEPIDAEDEPGDPDEYEWVERRD